MSQDITNLLPGEFYTLDFDYSIPYSNVDVAEVSGFCYLSFTLGGVGEPQLIGYHGPAQPAWGHLGGLDFIAPCAEDTLLFTWDCSELADGEEIDFTIDNVSLTGGECLQ